MMKEKKGNTQYHLYGAISMVEGTYGVNVSPFNCVYKCTYTNRTRVFPLHMYIHIGQYIITNGMVE